MRIFWRAGSYISCVGLRCVECRAGTIYLSASLEWMAGLFRFSLFWRCCSWCGMGEMVGGWSGSFFYIFFILLLILLVGGCLWQVFVLQYWFFLVTIGTIRGVVCYELLIFFLFVTGGTGRVGTWRTRSLCWSRRG